MLCTPDLKPASVSRILINERVLDTSFPEYTPPPVAERFDNLLIDPARVTEVLGQRALGEVNFKESEQADARRRLLHVEKIAIENKKLKAESDADYIDRVNLKFHEKLLESMREYLDNPAAVLSNILGINDSMVLLLDTLLLTSTSISRILPYASAIPWLKDDLVAIVNTPKFRRKDEQGKIVKVESLRSALSFLGIENLRMLLPSLIMKHCLAPITDPYPHIKAKTYQYSKASALVLKELCLDTAHKPHHGFLIGMFSQLGRTALTRLYFRLYDKTKRAMLKQSIMDKDTELQTAITSLPPSANYLIAIENEFSESLTTDLLAAMPFKSIQPARTMMELADERRLAPGSMAALLKQARTYSQIRMLHQMRFVDRQEIREIFRSSGISGQKLERLKSIDINRLQLASNSIDD